MKRVVCLFVSLVFCAGVAATQAVADCLPPLADDDDAEVVPDTCAEGLVPAGIAQIEGGTAAYSASFRGIDDSALRDLLERSSQVIALAASPPATDAALTRRIENDVERFQTVLRSQGYYGGRVGFSIDRGATPPEIVFEIETGPPYRLSSYAMNFVGNDSPPDRLPLLSELGLKFDQRAEAGAIVAAQKRLLDVLANRHRPFARIVDRRVVVDHETKTVSVEVDVDAGPPTRFGETKIIGRDRLEEDYVRTLIPWRQGDPYTKTGIDKLRKRLLATRLFSVVEIEHGESADATGETDITVRLVEAKPRSIGGGVKYSTSEGVGGEIFWEHRNLFSHHEILQLSAEANRFTQEVSAALTRPDFRRAGQDLVFEVTAKHADTKAFDEWGGETSAAIRRPLDDHWRITAGPSFEGSRLKDQDGTASVALIGLPTILERDDTGNRLDPRSGTRLTLKATPYTGWFDQSISFLQTEAATSGYQPLDYARRFVVAGRTRVGSTFGQPRRNVPANKRFYAGGGNSVRGYGYQKIGPLNDDDDPVGGRSLLELGAEFRAQVWGNFAVVPFVDGGTVYDNAYPDFSETFRWAAGIGLRYHTVIGPIRFDIAFPLNPRKGTDDPYQFYISIGQAF